MYPRPARAEFPPEEISNLLLSLEKFQGGSAFFLLKHFENSSLAGPVCNTLSRRKYCTKNKNVIISKSGRVVLEHSLSPDIQARPLTLEVRA